jgi:hypothetical protein
MLTPFLLGAIASDGYSPVSGRVQYFLPDKLGSGSHRSLANSNSDPIPHD